MCFFISTLLMGMAVSLSQNLILKDKRPPSTRITRVTERYETPMFKSNFDEWPIAPMIGDSSNKLKGTSTHVFLSPELCLSD